MEASFEDTQKWRVTFPALQGPHASGPASTGGEEHMEMQETHPPSGLKLPESQTQN